MPKRMQTAAMLEVHHLSLTIPSSRGAVEAVRGLSLTIRPGRVMGLVGESGCGKSLTSQALLRLGEHQGVMRSSGSVSLGGENLFSMDEKQLCSIRGKRIAMIFQEPMTALNPVFSIGDQMVEVIRLHLKMNRRDALKRALGLLVDVGMQEPEHVLQQYPDSLSGGMRQRVLIAMAISADPDYLIADEPTTALDVSVQKRIVALLRSLQKERNMGMLLVTHDFGLIAEIADDVAVMYAGEIVEQGLVADIFDQPAHPYTRALMACRPEIAMPGIKMAVIEGQVPVPGSWPVGCHFEPRCAFATSACRENHPALDHWMRSGHQARCLHIDDLQMSQEGNIDAA
ncbi:MAG: ABC transporter ATP-binding protein [Mariprofundaceae bacterium]